MSAVAQTKTKYHTLSVFNRTPNSNLSELMMRKGVPLNFARVPRLGECLTWHVQFISSEQAAGDSS